MNPITPTVILSLLCAVAAPPATAQTGPAPSMTVTAIGLMASPTRPAPVETPAPASGGTAQADEPGAARRFTRDVLGDYKHFLSTETAWWLGIGGATASGVHA